MNIPMSQFCARIRGVLLRCLAASVVAGSLAACGGGDVSVGIGVGVIVPVQPPAIAPLALALTRVGPADIEVAWSDAPFVASFLVVRNGSALISVPTTRVIDSSVYINATYCYLVEGYDARGRLVASSSNGCITVFP